MSSMTEIWPDWEMAELIGIGGWSRVYRAVLREHPEIQAAVKMIPAPDEEAEQILRGAQRMQQLSGKPGIVRIEDAAILPEGDGQSTVMPGMVRMMARSSNVWWLAPSSPTVMPACVAQILTFAPV